MAAPPDEGARRKAEPPPSATGYGLTESELALFGFVREFWHGFDALPQLHPADRDEVAFHLHACPGSSA
jgi:hypothetical protein